MTLTDIYKDDCDIYLGHTADKVVVFKSVAPRQVLLKAQSHLDVRRERVNTVWENHQHAQNSTCTPVNHPPTCSKRLSNVSKPTAHRVDTALVTFPKRVHTVRERVTACQTSIHPAVFYRATSVRLPYFGPWQYKNPITCFQSVGNTLSMLTSSATLICECMCCTQLWLTPCVFVAGPLHVSIYIISRNDKHSFLNPTSSKSPPRLLFFLPKFIRYLPSIKTILIICIYWQIISYENITELYSNVKISSYPIYKDYTGHS